MYIVWHIRVSFIHHTVHYAQFMVKATDKTSFSLVSVWHGNYNETCTARVSTMLLWWMSCSLSVHKHGPQSSQCPWHHNKSGFCFSCLSSVYLLWSYQRKRVRPREKKVLRCTVCQIMLCNGTVCRFSCCSCSVLVSTPLRLEIQYSKCWFYTTDHSLKALRSPILFHNRTLCIF